MKKLYFTISLTLILLSAIMTKADDSIPTTNLEELVVKSERSWIENGVFNFLPTKKEKQLSNSPGSLIKMMDIPLLKGDGDAIKTLSDEAVSIFINGEPANEIDLSTFWPSDVKKVEYMQNPSDPTFRGARNVVNFVMAKYEVGGVTRINARQNLPMTEGYYDLASKLSYKRMTYGLSVNSFCMRDKDNESEGITLYKDLFYNGIKYDEISLEERYKSDSEFWRTTVVANAKYTSEKFLATHTVGFIWSHLPGNSALSNSHWSQNLFGSEYSSSFNKSDSYTPVISGDYYGILSQLFTISGRWSYSHSDNSRFMSSKFGDTPIIENDFKEKVNVLPIGLNLGYRPDDKWTLFISLASKSQWFETEYKGSVNTHSNQFRESLQTALTAYWQPSSKLMFYMQPSILYNYYKIEETVNKYVTPTCSFNIGWYPGSKLNISGSLTYHQMPLSASASNPVIYKRDELTWVEGNPNLKPESNWFVNISIYYTPTDWIRFSSLFSYNIYRNSSFHYMESAPEDMGGILEIQRNINKSEQYGIYPSVSVSLFNRHLSLNLCPKFNHKITRNGHFRSLTCFQPVGDISYTIGNFNIEAKYTGRRKYLLDDSGNLMDRQPDNFSLGLSYGWKNLYVYCGVDDIFHNKYKTSSYSYYDVVTKEYTNWSTGRKFKLNLTYTFGYGKKVDQNINISAPAASDSSIL